jgi:hypothetical protein
MLRGGAYPVLGGASGGIGPLAHSGTSSSKITFQAYTGETPEFTGSYYPVYLVGNSYVRLIGITVHDTPAPYYMFWIGKGSNYNEIAHCVFYQSGGVSGDMLGYIGGDCNDGVNWNCPSTGNWIHDNVMHDVSTNVPCEDGRNIWQIGSAYRDLLSDNNTIENNVFYHCCPVNYVITSITYQEKTAQSVTIAYKYSHHFEG